MKKLILAVVAAFLLTGCLYTGNHLSKERKKLNETNEVIHAQAQFMAGITKEALALETNNTPAVSLATKTANETSRLLGQHPYKTFDTEGYITGSREATNALKAEMRYDTQLLISRERIKDKVEDIEADLVSKGIEYEKAHNKQVWWKFWTWSTATIIIVGLVCLCIFTPVGPMLIGGIIKGITRLFPALVNAFGVAAVSTTKNVIKGVGEVRWKLKQQEELPEEHQPKYTPTEVRQMIDVELKKALQDENDLRLVERLRKQMNVD